MRSVGPWVAVAVVAVLAAVVVVLAGGRLPWTDAQDTKCDLPDRVAGSAAAGQIRVVEQGFTQDPATGIVRLGAVLENTGTSVAYRTTVTFHLFDAAHTEVPGDALAVEIPIIMPRQRIGAGEGAYRGVAHVASLEISPGSTTWVPESAVGSFTPIDAKYVHTTRFNPRIPSSVDIHYRERSSNCRALVNKSTAVLFRDSKGKLIGGGNALPDTPIIFRDEHGKDLGGDPHRPPTPSCSPGERETWIVPATGAPADVDDTRTELYPYCDLD